MPSGVPSTAETCPLFTPFGGCVSLKGYRGLLSFPIMIMLGFTLVFAALTPPGIYSVDGNAMLAVAESLATHRGFTVPPDLGVPGVGGRIYSHWYPLLSVLALPFVYVSLVASRVSGLPFHYLAATVSLLLVGALTAATSGFIALLTLRLGGDRKGAWLAAVSYAIGTVALAYGRTFYAESLLAFLTVSALYFTFGLSRSNVLLGAGFAGLALLAKPAGILLGPILAMYLLMKRLPVLRSVLPLVGMSTGFLLYAAFNVIRFGHPLDFGIKSPFQATYFLSGVVGLIASPGYGLFWYCPPVILAVFGFHKAMRKSKFEALAIVATFAAFLTLHSFLPYWYAAWSWGPRYLVPVVPGLCALTGLLDGNLRRGLIFLTLVGIIVNVPTVFCFYERYYAELLERGVPTGESLAWSFRYAPSLHEWPAALHQVQDARKSDVMEIFQQRNRSPATTISSSRALRVVAIWWWVLPIAHIPRIWGVTVSLVLFISGFLLIGSAAFYGDTPTPGLRTAHWASSSSTDDVQNLHEE